MIYSASRGTEHCVYFLVTVSSFADPAPPAAIVVPAAALRELKDERVVTGCWRRLDELGIFLLMEAGDESELRRDVARLTGGTDTRVTVGAIGVELL